MRPRTTSFIGRFTGRRARSSSGRRRKRSSGSTAASRNDLATGKEVEMPSAYDETSERASPGYAGGTREQREHRDLLRTAMEREGFTVEPNEWWHFNYKDWKQYSILDILFEEIREDSGSPGESDQDTTA